MRRRPVRAPGAIALTPVNRSIRNWALILGMGRLGSTWDNTLDFQNSRSPSRAATTTSRSARPGRRIHAPRDGRHLPRADQRGRGRGHIGKQIVDELNAITGVAGTRDASLNLGSYSDGTRSQLVLGKADVDAGRQPGNQTAYDRGSRSTTTSTRCSVRIDPIGDIRAYRKARLPAGVRRDPVR
jgi:hypothetical protein